MCDPKRGAISPDRELVETNHSQSNSRGTNYSSRKRQSSSCIAFVALLTMVNLTFLLFRQQSYFVLLVSSATESPTTDSTTYISKNDSTSPVSSHNVSAPERKTFFPVDVRKICNNAASKVKDRTLPPSEILDLDEIYSIIKYWHEFNCPAEPRCNLESISQHLLHHAIELNKTLITAQVGAMDGETNDPMYEMFVREGGSYLGSRESFSDDLRHWLPVSIEPVPSNYHRMAKFYGNIAETTSLGCHVPINAAVSYDSPAKKECKFCRVNTSPDAPQQCQDLEDWMKDQLGTLDCESSERFFDENFDLCVLQDPLPCSSMVDLLSERSVPIQHVAILQIDIEGYEYALLEGFFNEMSDHSLLPPIIHFEHKVMRNEDTQNPLNGTKSRMEIVQELLENEGYILKDESEDYLAIRLHI